MTIDQLPHMTALVVVFFTVATITAALAAATVTWLVIDRRQGAPVSKQRVPAVPVRTGPLAAA